MKTLLIVAGLDPTAGAGLLADARVAADHGLRAVGVATALTVQDTTGVRAANPVPAEVVGDELHALLSDVEVTAVKIGMLGTEEIAHAIVRALSLTRAPIVWDPVLLPSRGGVPLYAGDPRALAQLMLPESTVVTPNLGEAAALIGKAPMTDVASMRRAATDLVAAGAKAALVKGGHLSSDRAVDVLASAEAILELDGQRLDAGPVHGTGCVLSAALACALARGMTVVDAARAAKDYVAVRLRAPLEIGRGARVLV